MQKSESMVMSQICSSETVRKWLSNVTNYTLCLTHWHWMATKASMIQQGLISVGFLIMQTQLRPRSTVLSLKMCIKIIHTCSHAAWSTQLWNNGGIKKKLLILNWWQTERYGWIYSNKSTMFFACTAVSSAIRKKGAIKVSTPLKENYSMWSQVSLQCQQKYFTLFCGMSGVFKKCTGVQVAREWLCSSCGH